MAPTAPTLINLPPPPSDPVTPSDLPGTPNSATTTMSELSTVAIKDGHRGHLPHHGRNAPHQPDAERADRISRLAGLERVATGAARQPTPISALTPGTAASSAPHRDPTSYFDGGGSTTSASAGGAGAAGGTGPTALYPGSGANVNPLLRERSTVGSASATGSVGGRTTTWAGTSATTGSVRSSGDDGGFDDADVDMDDEDRSEGRPGGAEDQDMMDRSSVGGLSDEGTTGSLVGFGEGARTPARTSAYYGSPLKSSATPAASAAGGSGRGESMTPLAAGQQETGDR